MLRPLLQRTIPRRGLAIRTGNPQWLSTSNANLNACLKRHKSSSSYPAAATNLSIDTIETLNTPSSPPRIYGDESELDEDEDFGGIYRIILPPEPFIFGTSHIPQRSVPAHIPRPEYITVFRADQAAGSTSHSHSHSRPKFNGVIELGGDEELGVREAAKLAGRVREYAGSLVKLRWGREAGVTTNEIDEAVHEFIISHSAYPSPLGYNGFPKSCCTSINNVVVHGIPDDDPLEEGDIINVDITLYLNGFHGDTSQTFAVGNIDTHAHHLISTTNLALEAGIAACGPGKPFKGIGQAIHDLIRQLRSGNGACQTNTLAGGLGLGLGGANVLNRSELLMNGMEKKKHWNYSVSSQFTGHGIGPVFHSPPWIVHSRNEEPGVMQPGHCFTIEPAIIQGDDARAWIFPDGWTASTENCARSAQAEHMILITHDGVEVLTR